MTRWIRPGESAAWTNLFETFRASAFRLEGLQTYRAAGEAEPLARFLAGKPHGADTSWWTSMVRSHRTAGHTVSRVRVITEPLTEYTRFELAVYPELVAAGEEIRVIHAPTTWPAGVPQHDYWLFDDQDLWIMHYEPDGRYLGAENIQDRDTVDEHRRWRDSALAQSVPLTTFQATIRQAS